MLSYRLESLELSMLGSGQDLSYSTKRKMSQRQKRTRVHRGTQTEECCFVDPLPGGLDDSDYRELHERLLKAEEVRTPWLHTTHMPEVFRDK